ncbi:OLC1v1022235C1 [Oldenlandia corymbosa var. corymbosa]|uniref:OLC1v1022235C1 n=1 Tax=Oldenlandia corymbosa var. corymbosa TaxID=529605 RepID=A0AAV1BYQ2_OLDCO|nr:OLC1v1022235C1 [Oldenlandia corymbosa var. corymbosa]
MAPRRKRKASSYYYYENGGDFPEHGAIFMSSSATKEECLRRNLFGLPMAFADFVEAVRPGMILFLYEYESRKLHGVFEATSNGQLNIVPHAFRSCSPKSFPAQVRVRVIRDCPPLLEDEFRDAIADNYYDNHKFKFGLSEQQVIRLQRLFYTQQMRVEKPLVMGDYIPLTPSGCCDIKVEVSLKGLYSDRMEHRTSVSNFNLHLQAAGDSLGTSSTKQLTYSDMVPRFVRQKEKELCQVDHHHPGNKIVDMELGEIGLSRRASVFSRLTYT